jgi:coenzyme F420-reducing hydrogenase gamma subunit
MIPRCPHPSRSAPASPKLVLARSALRANGGGAPLECERAHLRAGATCIGCVKCAKDCARAASGAASFREWATREPDRGVPERTIAAVGSSDAGMLP